MPNLTPEQQAVFDLATSAPTQSIIVDAKAGTGKTSTLIQVIEALEGGAVAMAFNKTIANELSSRLSFNAQLNTQVGTVHALGLAAYRASQPRGTRIKAGEGYKLYNLADVVISKNPSFTKYFNVRKKGLASLVRLTSLAKLHGFGLSSAFLSFPAISSVEAWAELAAQYELDLEFETLKFPLLDFAIPFCIQLLQLNNKTTHILDFDDMIYFPLLYPSPSFPTYQHVIVDECQDLSLLRIEFALRSLGRSGRLIAVGDPHQAIYGFTGASSSALDDIATALERRGTPAITLPLSVCFRCDPAIIREAQEQVPSIQDRTTLGLPSQPGLVTTHTIGEMLEVTAIDIDEQAECLFQEGDAILCRLNRPNVALCLELLRRNFKAKIEGKDLGTKLLKHYENATGDRASTLPLCQSSTFLENYLAATEVKLTVEDKPSRLANFNDELACLELLIDKTLATFPTAPMRELKSTIESIFGDNVASNAIITLSSIHKAKGREWPRVHILGYDDYMPFFMASTPMEHEQEQNLIYVAKTRAEHHLNYITEVKDWLDNR